MVNTPQYARIIITTKNNPTAEKLCIDNGLEKLPSSCGCHYASYYTKTEFEAIAINPIKHWLCPKTGLLGNFDNVYFRNVHQVNTRF